MDEASGVWGSHLTSFLWWFLLPLPMQHRLRYKHLPILCLQDPPLPPPSSSHVQARMTRLEAHSTFCDGCPLSPSRSPWLKAAPPPISTISVTLFPCRTDIQHIVVHAHTHTHTCAGYLQPANAYTVCWLHAVWHETSGAADAAMCPYAL